MISINPRYLYTAVIVVAAALMLVLVWHTPGEGTLYGRLQGLVYDATLPAASKSIDPRVVIVDIDEGSLAAEGRWPWHRSRVAKLLEQLQLSNPAVVGLDILFPEPSRASGDALLAEQIHRPNVVTAVTFALDAGFYPQPGSPWPQAREMAGLAASLYPPMDSPSQHPGHQGHITPLYDADHVIRRLYPMICFDLCYPTLAFAMLANWSSTQPVITTGPAGNTFCVGAFCQRTNRDGSLSIPFHFSGSFPSVSATRILSATEPLAELEGAMVLVGTSAVGLGDRVATPVSANTPGVQLHALVLAASLDNFHWSQLPYANALCSALIVLTALLALLWLKAGLTIKIGLASGATAILALTLLPPYGGYWLNPLPVWGSLLAAALLATVWEVYQVQSQRRKIYRAFAAYVPPVVLRTLVKQNLGPDQLDAQRADVTVFFADIQGFTSLSEQLEPEQLVEITSHLFSDITEEIHRHKGTLDKFMGDAVMAFWGAPLPQKNHPELAVDCALAVKRKLAAMKDWLAERGYPEIRMTMGLESGLVTVGNLGSRQRRAYTIMGKTVNLASHLQQQCKLVKKDILCGPELCRRLTEGKINLLPATEIRGIEDKQVIGWPTDDL